MMINGQLGVSCSIYKFNFLNPLLYLLLLCSATGLSQKKEQLVVKGLREPVEIIRDTWGLNHIYAKNQYDLFFAQGYAAAKDRLFQFEIWRRQATGTVAEILGARELQRDIGTRLFKFRGPLKEELNHYHEDGEEIINAYTDGVNAYINAINQTPELLPVEFKILGIKPQVWTADVVISRHQGLKGNVDEELDIGRAVAKIGAEKVKEVMWFHPNDPVISLDPKVEPFLQSDSILAIHRAYASRVSFIAGDISTENRDKGSRDEGSNNWVVNGNKTWSGYAIMANDPHRRIAVPSLRYAVHLVAPGWNVIGGGEPQIPGVSIGHNEFGAWGLTIFSTDGEDMYVYDLNPANLSQYRYKDHWVTMEEMEESIAVKGKGDVQVTLRYTRHGPVTYIDSVNNKAYAVRCAWLEKGGAPYLASLRMDQAKSWEEFRDACQYSHIPAENMVWADKNGNIGWQAVGITPIRENFSGLVPVPGDGSYEWLGYLPIKERPHLYNPETGFFTTANEHVTPKEYGHPKTLDYLWADPFRGERINEVLEKSDKITLEEMKQLQSDYFSIPAQTLVPMLKGVEMTDPMANKGKYMVLKWDYVLSANSVAAGIYNSWEQVMLEEAESLFIPREAQGLLNLQLNKLIQWLQVPGDVFGPGHQIDKSIFIKATFTEAMQLLEEKLGPDMGKWKYGQAAYKHAKMEHMLSAFVSPELRSRLDVGPFPRGGNRYTPNSTGNTDNQLSGASFKFITDLSDWDKAWMINTPGQSGNPDSPYYRNLGELWAGNGYFPAYYSRSKIEGATAETTELIPE